MREYLFQIVFYLSAALTILGAVAVVLQKNPVRAVLALVFSFFMVSIVWMMSNAEFLALVLVLVYVGAVMTLFLFVVMMLNIDTASLKRLPKRFIAVSAAFMLFFIGLLWHVLPKDLAQQPMQASFALGQTAADGQTISNTSAIAKVLYTDYAALTEITALLLLVAIVASITLVHRGGRQIKRQSIREQIMVSKESRLKIVQVSSHHQDKG